VGTFSIGEVAERTGFTASALRYYEGIGLVRPSSRTAAGHRVYDDDAVARLSFIARAKGLGCTLDEVADLVELWDGEACAPVQRRLHDLVTGKVEATRRRISELTALEQQLRTAAGRLGTTPSDGPCAEGCACVAPEVPADDRATPTTTATATITAISSAWSAAGGPPIACTLNADAVPGRVERWHRVVGHAVHRTTTDAGALRLTFAADVPLGELAELVELVAAEQACCAFLAFAVTVDDRGIALEVAAPDGAEAVVAALFGDAR
jgi:DNA-binding transcriptional MerR regulator